MSLASSLSLLGLTLLAGSLISCSFDQPAPVAGLAEARSGYDFQSTDTQHLQDDNFANPGMLWVDRGATLWSAPSGTSQQSCETCHGDAAESMRGVASHYPAFVPEANTVLNLEGRIHRCQSTRQKSAPFPYESDELLSLTAYVAHQSRGIPTAVDISGPAREFFDEGEAYFHTRRGQMNLACVHCHERYVGHQLRGDTLSQGQSVGYPIYRLEWQSLGSLQRRLRFCNTGVRAEPLPFGAQTWTNLELYLQWRAGGLEGETPAVRR